VFLFVAGVLALACTVVTGNTFTVTSSSCTGSGSFVEALNSANANPGFDTIEFMGVSEVDAVNCPAVSPNPLSALGTTYGYVNDSVIIKGNGVKMVGSQLFVTSGGLITPLDGSCPSTSTSTDVIVRYTYGFLYIDGPNVNVTIQNMTIFEHEYILRTTSDCDNCSIILDSVNATRIIPIVSCLSSSAVTTSTLTC